LNNSSWKFYQKMLRLLDIEFFKLRNTKYFWVLSGLFILFLFALPIGFRVLLNYLTSIGENMMGWSVPANQMPFYDFVDIWQNLTWSYMNFSILLGFIMVISINNEYTYGTIKQNVIDGLSRSELMWSKLSFIIVLSFVISIVTFFVGLIFGMLYSPTQGWEYISLHLEFIPAYFMHLVVFQLFCLVISMLIKRPGITISLLVFYIFVIEPIASVLLFYKYKLEFLANILPMKAISNIVPMPWTKYAFKETQTSLALDDAMIMGVWAVLLYFIARWILLKRDLV